MKIIAQKDFSKGFSGANALCNVIRIDEMAYDRSTTTHHLTEDGWVHEELRPEKAVETWVCRTHQASGWSKEDRDWSCEWADPKTPRESRDTIRNRFAAKVGMIEGVKGNVRVSVGTPK